MNRQLNILSFNRYIVECKYVRSKGKEFDGFSFNRYIVECKWAINP